jgi:DNA-binding transcriptional MerR regulator
MLQRIPIGEAARATGVKVPTIRYYEQIGLLPAPSRTEGNRRTFHQGDLHRLAFIRHSRELGFSLDAIRQLLELSDEPNQSCIRADQIARGQLEDVKARIQRLEALKQELERMITQCSHGKVSQCRVIEVLADHGRCLSRSHDLGSQEE